MRTAVYTNRDRRLANLIWRQGPLSRAELIESTGVHRNLVGTSADRLLKLGLIREATARSTGPGRPSLPLEVNPAGGVVVGLSIAPGTIEATTLSLRGGRVGAPIAADARSPDRVVHAAASLLKRAIRGDVFAVGVSVTGLVDPATKRLLFSSATTAARDVSLAPLFAAAGATPLIVDNDQHALAARWLLTHRADPREDVLLVGFDDGRMGASHLVDGRPARGCVVSANELGHTRLPIDTPRCYCGHRGCLERACSTAFVHRHGLSRAHSLGALLAEPSLARPAFDALVAALACGFSNAVNFARPHRLVLASPLGRRPAFVDALTREVRARVLPALVERVRIEWWDEPTSAGGENAAWLALASAFYEGWRGTTAEYDIRRGPQEDSNDD